MIRVALITKVNEHPLTVTDYLTRRLFQSEGYIPKRLNYSDKGALRGTTPSGDVIIIRHLQHGPSRFEIVWAGETRKWLYAKQVEYDLGIVVKGKKSGGQKGYPQEAVLRAVWRYFVDCYNEFSPAVELLSS